MASQLQSGTEAISPSVSHDSEPSSPQTEALAFFPHAQHFVVSGGHFISNVMNSAPSGDPGLPPDFRRIPLGDLDLRREIQGGRIVHQYGRGPIRRLYSARIEGQKSVLTAAIYQGEDAEKDWKREVARYTRLRHPNFVQIYGVVSSCDLYATVFHDDLIPMKQFLERYRHSPISTLYLSAHFYSGFIDAQDYFLSVAGIWLDRLDCTFWIRRSTTQLCVAIAPNSPDPRVTFLPILTNLVCIPISAPAREWDAMIIASLSLTEYHARVNLYTVHRLSLRAHTRIGPGAIVLTSSPRPVEIAYIPECDISDTGWRLSSGAPLASVLMLNGWTRLDAADSTAGLSRRIKYCGPRHCWLAQANYMFSQVETESREDEYVFVDEVAYYLQLAKPSARPSPGYLFLCPFQDLQHASTAAYWSCDPSGIERRGPALKLIVKAWGHSWDAFLYAGLQQFHRGKGFDPRSQDVARHLGFPLYRLSPRAVVGKEDVSKNEKQTPDVQGGWKNAGNPVVQSLSGRLEAAEMLPPPSSRNVVMLARFALILILAAHSLYQFALLQIHPDVETLHDF